MNNVRGIGIDLVSIQEIQELDERTKGVFSKGAFSQNELLDAEQAHNKYEFLAGRFAVKEAVFKAICGTHPDIEFDFRIVETMRLENGAPKVVINDKLKEILDKAQLSDVLISISNEKDMAVAIAQVIE